MSQAAEKTRFIRPRRGGRITIPIEFRRALGIGDETVLRMTLEDGEVRLRPVANDNRGSQWFKDLYDLFAPVRAEIAAEGYTEEEVNAWIDEAVAAVRAERLADADRSKHD